MTTPRHIGPRPLPPSDARVEVTPAPRTSWLRRERWHLRLVDGPLVLDLGHVVGPADRAEAEAYGHLRAHLLPTETPGAFIVRGEPLTGPAGPSGATRPPVRPSPGRHR